MNIRSPFSLAHFVLVTGVGSFGCRADYRPYDDSCDRPTITALSATPFDVSASDSVTIYASLASSCPSTVTLTFPEYDPFVYETFSGYDLQSGGIVMNPIEDSDTFAYATSSMPAASFLDLVKYKITAASGFPTPASSSLYNYFIVHQDTADTGR